MPSNSVTLEIVRLLRAWNVLLRIVAKSRNVLYCSIESDLVNIDGHDRNIQHLSLPCACKYFDILLPTPTHSLEEHSLTLRITFS